LERLALQGDDRFTYSFGDSGDPVGAWRAGEAAGEQPLRFLAELLDRPFATTVTERGLIYVWPAPAAYPTWTAVPGPVAEDLLPLYSEEDLRRFRERGVYDGYRIGITDRGDWIYFLAGD
jgi:hypothetical protein